MLPRLYAFPMRHSNRAETRGLIGVQDQGYGSINGSPTVRLETHLCGDQFFLYSSFYHFDKLKISISHAHQQRFDKTIGGARLPLARIGRKADYIVTLR